MACIPRSDSIISVCWRAWNTTASSLRVSSFLNISFLTRAYTPTKASTSTANFS
ncbi:hypothetical protein D3C81_2261340 [compost metagenome]